MKDSFNAYLTYHIVGFFEGENSTNFTNHLPFVKNLPLKCLLKHVSLSALDDCEIFPSQKVEMSQAVKNPPHKNNLLYSSFRSLHFVIL